MYGKLTNEFGFNNDNTYLSVHLPATDAYLVFRVKSRLNTLFPKFTFGSLPITNGQVLSTIGTTGGTVSAPAANVMPAMSYMTKIQFAPPSINGQTLQTFSTSDMWFTAENYRSSFIELLQVITPSWIRADVQIPIGVEQTGFQQNKVSGGVQTYAPSFGFKRGRLQSFHIPYLNYGFSYGNDTNMAVYTRVIFYFAEYNVEIPRDPELIFQIINHKVEARSVTLPYQTADANMNSALQTTYGITGFPGYGLDMHDKAISDYSSIMTNILKGV